MSHARANAARHVVIVTDGPANDPQIVAMEAPWLQSVATVISVAFDAGSTPPISLEEQFSIAGDVNRMFRVNSDNELPGLFDEIAFLISGSRWTLNHY